MIAFLEGVVRFLNPDSVLVDVNGVGYEVFVPDTNRYRTGASFLIFTYQHFQENDQSLYGFSSQSELEVFKRLIKVKGVGVKTALNALKTLGASDLMDAINQSDLNRLKKIPGIGARSASQIVLDLQGKIVLDSQPDLFNLAPSVWKQACAALESLGYKPSDLAGLEKEVDLNSSINDIVKQSLRLLAIRKGL